MPDEAQPGAGQPGAIQPGELTDETSAEASAGVWSATTTTYDDYYCVWEEGSLH